MITLFLLLDRLLLKLELLGLLSIDLILGPLEDLAIHFFVVLAQLLLQEFLGRDLLAEGVLHQVLFCLFVGALFADLLLVEHGLVLGQLAPHVFGDVRGERLSVELVGLLRRLFVAQLDADIGEGFILRILQGVVVIIVLALVIYGDHTFILIELFQIRLTQSTISTILDEGVDLGPADSFPSICNPAPILRKYLKVLCAHFLGVYSVVDLLGVPHGVEDASLLFMIWLQMLPAHPYIAVESNRRVDVFHLPEIAQLSLLCLDVVEDSFTAPKYIHVGTWLSIILGEVVAFTRFRLVLIRHHSRGLDLWQTQIIA